jgi:hypothetical protein
MAYTDLTYYINDINIPAEKFGSDNYVSVINRYEPEILKKLLGHRLYTLMEASPTDTRFTALINGAEFNFDYQGQTIYAKWDGLLNSKKISLLSYYVYYMDRNETEQFNSGAGQVSSSTENSTRVDVRPKLIHTWNKMIDLYGLTPWNLVYCDGWINQNNYEHYNILPSAYNFLLANIETYPEWVFEPLGSMNIFGI